MKNDHVYTDLTSSIPQWIINYGLMVFEGLSAVNEYSHITVVIVFQQLYMRNLDNNSLRNISSL